MGWGLSSDFSDAEGNRSGWFEFGHCSARGVGCHCTTRPAEGYQSRWDALEYEPLDVEFP